MVRYKQQGWEYVSLATMVSVASRFLQKGVETPHPNSLKLYFFLTDCQLNIVAWRWRSDWFIPFQELIHVRLFMWMPRTRPEFEHGLLISLPETLNITLTVSVSLSCFQCAQWVQNSPSLPSKILALYFWFKVFHFLWSFLVAYMLYARNSQHLSVAAHLCCLFPLYDIESSTIFFCF